MSITTRIAPSPTGYLHLGTARTALFSYLVAARASGKFILRIEDTDKERSKPEYEAVITEGLSWLGIPWDAFYRQSEQIQRHTEVLQELVKSEKAYVSEEPAKDDPSRMVSVVRLKNPGKRITFIDAIRGEVSFDTAELGDFVIARSMNDPLYHLAVVVDDHDEGVTHVIRAEEHLSNTPRQILIHEALGFSIPAYAHLPLILAPDKSKLSKRKGTAVALTEYRDRGFLPNALLNYLALLGWNPGNDRELFSLSELKEIFDLGSVQKSGAVFDEDKLRWFNKQYLLRESADEQRAYVLAGFRDASFRKAYERSPALVCDLIERVSVRSDIATMEQAGEFDFLKTRPLLDIALIPWKKDTAPENARTHLTQVKELLSTLDETSWKKETIEAALMPYALAQGKGSVLWPLRYTLTGRERSPDPFTVAEALGREETIARIAEVDIIFGNA